ncbi:hypothetical protein [Bifidobacterium apri]|uniref:Uncharacterized protein n=1 Tax=Bifidobacterium apri TaxID=1769423 RepID=A0A6A2V5V1_9BIFI|nr:hypothetical protein [Bifidobacterium apri]KAB8291886.1 hypothetical protein DSM100238_1826 [Bifidobacterium apri]
MSGSTGTVQQIENGDITPYEAASQLAVVTAMLKQLKTSEKALRDYLTGQLGDREHLTTMFGEVTQKRGAQAKWRVTDPVEYAKWLISTGHEDMTVTLPVPVDDACKPDAISAFITANGGEVPPREAADLKGGSADSVTVKPAGTLSELAAKNKRVNGDMRLALGMAPEEPESESDDVEGMEF